MRSVYFRQSEWSPEGLTGLGWMPPLSHLVLVMVLMAGFAGCGMKAMGEPVLNSGTTPRRILMVDTVPQAKDLVLTEADQVPVPETTEKAEKGLKHEDSAALMEVKMLAERLGGPERLRELVEQLLQQTAK
jgi:hypothetical protein